MALADLRPRPSARRRMNMFYLLDTSGSMRYNDCIGSVNRAMPEIVGILREISDSNHDQSDIYLSCITFDNEARELYDAPVDVKDFRWADVKAEGLTNLKAAFDLLEAQLQSGWEEALDRLQANLWFRQAYKIAIAIGCKPSNIEMCRALTRFARPLDAGGEPVIISIDQLDRLYDVIKLVSSTVSRIGSSNAAAGGRSPAQRIRDAIVNDAGNIVGVNIPSMLDDGQGWY